MCHGVELFGVHHTMELSFAMCILLWSWALRCASHRVVKLGRVLPNAESSFKGCITQWNQVHQIAQKLCGVHPTAESSSTIASHCGVKLRIVHHTAKSNCTPQSQNWNLCEYLVASKGTIRRNTFCGEHIYHERKYLITVAKPKILSKIESSFFNFVIRYLCEIETKFRNT